MDFKKLPLVKIFAAALIALVSISLIIGAVAINFGLIDKNSVGEFTPQSNSQTLAGTPPASDGQADSSSSSAQQQAQPQSLPNEYRAMWISYLEWQSVDFSSSQSFSAAMDKMFDNCLQIGVNTVIVQVRPFGDALYKSEIYPWSSLITGTQGQDPGYDPLAIMVEKAHSRNLKIEAWINPYRIKLNEKVPGVLSSNNPAVLDSEITSEANGGLYYNPALQTVQTMVVKGVEEIVSNYDIDGIQFDDYFYPTTDAAFDKAEYDILNGGSSLENWRRENVNSLIKKVYSAIKAIDDSVYFGISPQGNNDNNYNVQYSDIKLWISQEGYVDYIAPQLYWGFDYTTKSGSDKFKFINCMNEWAAYPRAENIKLYIGLGTFRIGDGDGGANDQAEWQSGEQMAKMINAMRSGANVNGYIYYRYDHLFNSPYPQLAAAEIENIQKTMG